MIQYLSFNKSKVEELNLNLISGYDGFKFHVKKIGYIILLAYSTLFVAAIDPSHFLDFLLTVYEWRN